MEQFSAAFEALTILVVGLVVILLGFSVGNLIEWLVEKFGDDGPHDGYGW